MRSLPIKSETASWPRLIYAWYYACWIALAACDVERVRMLYECALTTTVCMRVTASLAEVVEASVEFAERVRVEALVVVDNFVTFTGKVMLMYGGKKPDLVNLTKKTWFSTAAP